MLKTSSLYFGLLFTSSILLSPASYAQTADSDAPAADTNVPVTPSATPTANTAETAQAEDTEINQAVLDDILGDENPIAEEPEKTKAAQAKAEIEDDEEEEKSPWESELEFGYQSHTGNEDNQSLNARLYASYINGPMRYQGEFKAYAEDEDGEEDKRQMSYQLQGDYKLGPRSYLYSNFKGIDSKYSSYFHDYTLSAGLGYQLYNTKKLKLESEIGPGYRYQDPNTDEIDSDDPILPDVVREAIIRGSLNAKWQALKNLSLESEFTLVSGNSNTRFDTDINAITKMNEFMAFKMGFSRQYLTKVPEGLSHDDTVVSMNILFSF